MLERGYLNMRFQGAHRMSDVYMFHFSCQVIAHHEIGEQLFAMIIIGMLQKG